MYTFQKCGWMDEKLNMEWVDKTLATAISEDPIEKVLFCDNVNFQLAKEFHEECGNRINTVVYLLPANHTDKVQHIDAGFGYMMKSKFGDAMERWLEVDDNLDRWHDKLPARERRILMTKWVAEAWNKLKARKDIFWNLFEKTGCLITADSSEDEK